VRTILFVCLFVLKIGNHVSNVYADVNWVDITVYSCSETYYPAIKNWADILANENDCENVEVYIVSCNNSLIKYYLLTANDSQFVEIKNGSIVKNDTYYWNLYYGQTLSFDLSMQPIDSISAGSAITIIRRIVIYKDAIGDINGDGIVNVYDGILLGDFWGQNSTSANWD
jgi:hypothetical protein